LLEDIELLRRKRFGPSADRIPDAQLRLFDESEREALIAALEADLSAQTRVTERGSGQGEAQAPKQQPVRRPLPAHLPRVERLIEVSDEEKAALGDDGILIGYDTSEPLGVIPRQYYVISDKCAQ